MTTLMVSQPRCESSKHDDPSGCAYRIAWSINPHMRVGGADTAIAVRQHASFVRALRQAGADVQPMPFVHGAFDSVFTKDSAILADLDRRGPRALLASPRHAQRAPEQSARRQHLRQAGFDVVAPLDAHLEGGDVVIFRGGALLGHGFRSSARAATGLSRFLGEAVIPLELRDPALYHLDTALTILDDGTVVFAESAFTPTALRSLQTLPFRRFITVPEDEARRFGLNVVEIGDVIVTGTASPYMDALWTSLDKRVVHAPLDEFQHAGGSAACLVAKVHRPHARVSESATAAILSTAA